MKGSKYLISAIAGGLIFFLASPVAMAAKFANQFVEFELPPQWQCNLEGAEWVCQSLNEQKKREAIIVLAAKLKGDQDSIDQYLSYLQAPKNYTNLQGRPVTSQPKYAKSVSVNGQPWVDSLHMESEIPEFYTRYLATVKQDIGVLVTYSIHKSRYQEYLNDMENLVKTLKVFRKAGGINAAPAQANLFQTGAIPPNVAQNTVFPSAETPAESARATRSKESDNSMLWIIGGAAAILFILWRRRQQG